MAQGKFTFRKEPKVTGLAGIAQPHQGSSIKLGGKICGKIAAPSRFGADPDNYRVRLMVVQPETEEDPAGWRWVTFKAQFKSDEDARAWLQANEATLRAKYELYLSEDDF